MKGENTPIGFFDKNTIKGNIYGIKEFKVNQYITLRLEDNSTNIYVNGKLFNQCKYLLLNISKDNIEDCDEYKSIDEAAEFLDNSLELSSVSQITPFEEFFGHCSNLQTWYEYGYDTRLLHSDLAFPLLKKLAKVGDLLALRAFKEEIATRFESGFPPTILFLVKGHYLSYLHHDELTVLLENIDFSTLEKYSSTDFFQLLMEFEELGVHKAKLYYKEEIRKLFEKYDLYMIGEFLHEDLFTILNNEEFGDFSVDFIEKVGNFRDHKSYFEVIEALFYELHRRSFFSDKNPYIEKIITSFFSQITVESHTEWSEIIFGMLDHFRDLMLYPMFLSELLVVFNKLDRYKRGVILRHILWRIKDSEIVYKQFGLLFQMLEVVLADITEIETAYDAGYMYSDLLLSLDKTPFLREVCDALREKLVYILNNLNLESQYATGRLVESLLSSILSIVDNFTRSCLYDQLKAHSIYNKFKDFILIRKYLEFDTYSLKQFMEDHGAASVDLDTALSLQDYLYFLAESIINTALKIAHHLGEKRISIRIMELVIALVSLDKIFSAELSSKNDLYI